MATFRKRNGRWHVQVRRVGYASRTKSFLSKSDGRTWARQIEAEFDKTVLPSDPRVLEQITISDLLRRYEENVTRHKKGAPFERQRIRAFRAQGWASKPLSTATPQVFSQYRDDRQQQVSAGTLIRELGLLHAIFEKARQEWGFPLLENPLARVKKPKNPDPRERRLLSGELDKLLVACEGCRNDWLRFSILFAIQTGMRRGELLRLRWSDVCLDRSVLSIQETKNGHPRCIPLTAEAVALLGSRQAGHPTDDSLVVSATANAFRLAWERCKRRAAKTCPALIDLRFHDLRHEAVSRFFELGLSVPEVALISGHRDPRMLFRYTHLRAENIVAKLRVDGAVENANA